MTMTNIQHKLVQYNIPNMFQCQVGEIIKEGSKRVFVRERNVSRPQILELNIHDNNVIYLLGAKNKFDSVKGVSRAQNK